MKSARILVLILFLGFGLSVTLLAWGQQPNYPDDKGPRFQLGQSYDVVDRRDVEMDKLLREERAAEHEVGSLIESYTHTGNDTERSKIKSKVTVALEKAFDLQQKRRELELSRVEARVKKIRELMQKRGEARQSIIDKRLDQLLREADGLGWTPPPGVNMRQFQNGNPIDRGYAPPLPK
jgi:hypothetical protein